MHFLQDAEAQADKGDCLLPWKGKPAAGTEAQRACIIHRRPARLLRAELFRCSAGALRTSAQDRPGRPTLCLRDWAVTLAAARGKHVSVAFYNRYEGCKLLSPYVSSI